MQYKRFGNTIVVRIDRGEEITEKIKEAALKENVRFASVQAIGATDEFEAGAYDLPQKKYNSRRYAGVFEIVSLLGTIDRKDGEYYAHFHISAADENGVVFGGHLNSARVSATCEALIRLIEGDISRRTDEITGVNLWEF